jgi:methyl-accepting chemotaxis protein
LVKNLTDFAQWFRVRVQAVNESLLADEAMANRTIELRGRAAEFNISHARKRAQKDLAEVVEALNKTELFQALDEVQKVRETLQARENQTHDVLGQIVASVNRTTESIGDKSVVYKEMVTKFGNIITTLAREFPVFMKQETDAYTHGIQEEGRLLGEMIEKHDYKATDFKKEMDKLYFVPMLGDIIRETETNLFRSAQGIEAPKDYASEISDIKQELQELTQSHNQFIAEQRKRVHEVKMRRSQKSGKHHK